MKQSEPSTSTSQAGKEFPASKGWLIGLLKRNALHNIKITGESVTVDGAAKIFPEELAKIIEDGGYFADQVFNADETGLYWKKLPNRTYIAKDEKTASGHKASKDRVTLLLCSNASGDRMLKPLLINKSLRPRALKGEAVTSNDQVQNTKSPPVPPSKRPTEEFITDNAAAISELLKLREAYAADARKIAIIPSTRDEYSHFQGELGSIHNKLIAVRDSLDVPLFSIPLNQVALDKIVARVTSKRKKAAAPTENNISDNTRNVPKSLVKWETRERATIDEDGFRLPPKKQTTNPNGKPFLSSPAAILTHPNSSAPSAPPIILSNAYEEAEEIEFDTEQVFAAVAPRVKIPPFFIHPNPDWTDLMVFAHSLTPTLQSKLSGRFLRFSVQSEEEYRKLATYFRHEQIAFKSFMLKSERPLKLILRGLPTSAELEAVKKETESEGFKTHKISRLRAVGKATRETCEHSMAEAVREAVDEKMMEKGTLLLLLMVAGRSVVFLRRMAW
ncbi:tigger transposable element-derived protein 1 [Trichonephila clavipes]|nr:tigger transposable element-derived protein 1 [Trichonephila clavipes]